MTSEIDREGVEIAGGALDPVWRLELGVNFGKRARRQFVKLHPIGAAVLIGVGHEPDSIGELVAFELSEPLEDGFIGVGLFPRVVLNAGIFHVLYFRAQIFQSLPPLAGALWIDHGLGARSTVPNGGAGQTGAMAAHTSGRVSPIQRVPPPPIESPVR